MPLPKRSSTRRRRKKGPDEEERAAGSPAEVMAPTRMKSRGRRRDAVPPGGAPSEANPEPTRRSSRRRNASKAPAEAAPPSSGSPPTTSSGSARPAVAAEASPDSKCPICSDRFNNSAYSDHCSHRFCFPCIQEWSHNKAECPLCKQPFASISHSVRAEDDFKEYTSQPPPPPRPGNQSTASTFLTTVAAMTSDGGTQHHSRSMSRRHSVAADREAVRRRRRRERAAGGRRMGEEWEFFMHSPPLPVSPYHLNVSEIFMDNMRVEEVAEEMMRRDEERSSESAGSRGPAAPSARASRRSMSRSAVRQRSQREGGLVRMRERELTAFRKASYQCGIRVQGVSGSQGRQRSVTAESFRRSAAHSNRLQAWSRRESAVSSGPHASLVDVVQRAVTARALDSGSEDAAAMEDESRPFSTARTEHFVHESVSFARSSLSMESYDQQAVYEPPSASVESDELGSSSDGSSVIAISEEEEEEVGGQSEAAAGGGSSDDVIRTGSSLSSSGWDDETPGPSYTTAETSQSLSTPPPLSPAPQEPANQEVGEARGEQQEEEECSIVGYKKPMAERTPESVQSSSDSDEEDGGKKKKEEEEVALKTVNKTPPTSSPVPPSSYLPIIPPSTSGAFSAGEKEGGARRRRSRSWSESSGRSGRSVCSVSPATPTGRRRDGKQHGDRRKRSKRGPDGIREPPRRRSGTFCNPNRSIFPPMMTRCSPSPFDSSADSASSPPRSPPDSSWELRFGQVSPFTSSASSRSLSPLLSSPPGTPPTPACSPKRPHHSEKPGGKRKYKSRHLNSSKDPSWRPNSGQRRERETKRKKKREVWGRGNVRNTGSRRSRDDRSPSVEIIYEGTVDSSTSQPSGHKRRRRRQRRAQLTSSPVIITSDSDSSHDDDIHRKTLSCSSSPLSSQQTIDFSDSPPLPPLPTAGISGNADQDVGELPADISDRASDGSDCEVVDPSVSARRANTGDLSFVDVENVEEDAISSLDTSDDQPVSNKGTEPAAGGGRRPEASPSDRYSSEAISNDSNRIAPPKRDPSQNTDTGVPAETIKRTPQEIWPKKRRGSGPAPTLDRQQKQVPSPPPSDRMEGREVPPLLRRASPVGSYNRNTPPPSKHKDAGSPQQWLPCSSGSDPVSSGLNKHTIPPITTLKSHSNSVLTSTSGAAIPSTSHRPPAASHPLGSDYLPSPRLGSFPSTESYHRKGSLKSALPDDSTPGSSSHLHPAHCSSTSRGDWKSPTRSKGSDTSRSSSWDVFSGSNSTDTAAFRPDVPTGGTLPGIPNPAGGKASAASLTPPSASNHKALPSSSYTPSKFSFQSNSGLQNHSDSGSIQQPLKDLKVKLLQPNISGPEPQNNIQPDPNTNLQDPALHLPSESSHRPFTDSALRLPFYSNQHSHDSALRLPFGSSLRPSTDSTLRIPSDSSHHHSTDKALRPSSDSSHGPSSDSALRLSSDYSHRPSADSALRLSSDYSHGPSADSALRLSSDSSHRPSSHSTLRSSSDSSHRPSSDSALRMPSDSSHHHSTDKALRFSSDHSHGPSSDSALRSASDSLHRPSSDSALRSSSDSLHRPSSDSALRSSSDSSLRSSSDSSHRPSSDSALRLSSDSALRLSSDSALRLSSDSALRLSSDSSHIPASDSALRLSSVSSHRPSSDSALRLSSDSSHRPSSDSALRLSSDSSRRPSSDSALRHPSDSAPRIQSDSSHHHSTDSALRIPSDSSHRPSPDSALRLSFDSSQRLSTYPTLLFPYDSSHRVSSDSSHRVSSDSALPTPSHRNFDPDNHLSEQRS